MPRITLQPESQLIPALPQSKANINNEGPWRLTSKRDPILLADDGDADRILIFSTSDVATSDDKTPLNDKISLSVRLMI